MEPTPQTADQTQPADQPAADPVFAQEQEHLSFTHAKLTQIEADLQAEIARLLADAAQDRGDMADELGVDFGNGVNLETWVEMQAMQAVLDGYNLAADVRIERLASAQRLLRQPYFAKVRLQFKPGEEPRDLYIGSAGMTDETRRHFIIDWRSPVAEVYYNQENGQTSYQANGRTIHVDLQLRRQFDVDGARLNGYFDTTVAIQDPLLLQSLSRGRSDKLRAITATIQREQNQVIRHEDVPALLVSGVAGSGKTSVLLQRIAYLFYQQRDSLDPGDVWLITPNDLFARYISDVLPDMGERNPQTTTWDTLMERLGSGGRGLGDATADELLSLDDALASFRFEQADFREIRVGDERVLTQAAVANAALRLQKTCEPGTRFAALLSEELAERLTERAKRLAADEDVQAELLDLSADEQHRIFGQQIVPQDENEFREYTLTYLTDRYAAALDDIADGAWLRLDRVGMRLLGRESLSAAEHLYLKVALTGAGNRFARYVMIDEAQDYTAAQLVVLARYFRNAHFLLLGDEMQAIRPGTASFAEAARVLTRVRGGCERVDLTTSYRSTPAVTSLFSSLMDPGSAMEVNSVQREGETPHVHACETQEAYEAVLRAAVAAAGAPSASEDGGPSGASGTQDAGAPPARDRLVAVIAPHAGARKRLTRLLGNEVTPLSGNDALPKRGVVLIDLAHAKGLEFDEVIVTEAQSGTWGEGDLERRRLYTAISRATRKVTVLANGPLTPLLREQ